MPLPCRRILTTARLRTSPPPRPMALARIISAGAGAAVRDGTAASPLLGPLLNEWGDVFAMEVLKKWLDPTDCALLARACWKCGEAVVSSGAVMIAGDTRAMPLKVKDLFGSIELLTWAKDNGCPWVARVCETAAQAGHLEALQWARENDCPWDERTCYCAARGGHIEVLRWAREHHCPWTERTCKHAAYNGHLDVLRWAWEHGCPWSNEGVRAYAAAGGHSHRVLTWLDEHGD